MSAEEEPVETPVSTAATNVNWLIANFVTGTAGVERAVAVSTDGLVVAMSEGIGRDDADRLAAVVTGLQSLAEGAARVMGVGGVDQIVVEMHGAYLLVAAIGDGSTLGVVASKDCDLGLVGYEITLLVQRVGSHLTPELVAELRAGLEL